MDEERAMSGCWSTGVDTIESLATSP
jgi:hypothetical protein